MRLNFFRHGMTKGNQEGRYVGTTDEPLCHEGKGVLEGIFVPKAELVYASPMLRCLETARILYPGQDIRKVQGFEECDFGLFEYKSYEELNGRKDYQDWIDTGGKTGFPQGESLEAFQARVNSAFESVVGEWQDTGCESAAFVVHGGTIMCIFDCYASPHRPYFEWQAKNGQGYQAEIFMDQWSQGNKELRNISRV